MPQPKKSSQGTPKRQAPKKAPQASPASLAGIDTDLAAQTAARFIGARAAGTAGGAQNAAHETSTFKQLKESLVKPHLAGVEGFLNSSAPATSKKSSAPSPTAKQVGHNQTFGSDVSRRNVPRRTAG